MRKVKVDWVFMGPEPYLATCRRCGEHVAKPPMPTPLDAAIKYFEYASEAHKFCKEAVTP
jgi:hypothetical protein